MQRNIERKIRTMTKTENFAQLGLYLILHKSFKGILADKNLRYQPTGKRAYLDIFRKEGQKGKKPLFVYIHGGGWLSGSRGSRRPYCCHWVEKGFVAANIAYDYGIDVQHPEHIREIFCALAYVLEHAEEYGIDTSHIVLAGESAGAYFAALVAAISTHRELYDMLGISFPYQDSFQVSACVLLSGIFDPVRSLDTGYKNMDVFVQAFCGDSPADARAKKAQTDVLYSPEVHVDSHFPPSFVIGSSKDLLLSESKHFCAALTKAGVQNDFYLCRGINSMHAGSLSCSRGKTGKESSARTWAFLQGLSLFTEEEPVAPTADK